MVKKGPAQQAKGDRLRSSTFEKSRTSLLPELLVLALAALTRFWRLDYHSIWLDEAISLQWAASAPEYTWDVTLKLVQEKHPPLYYVTLHYWWEGLKLLGLDHSDAGLRALGSLLGVLTVLAMILLIRRISGRPTALLAGTLIALSPVLVWYSQEVRMFQPAATAIAWAAYFLIRAWDSERPFPRLAWWAAMSAAFLAALYSYLFSALILPAAGLTLLLLAGHTWGRKFWEGVSAFALTGLLFLPLLRNAWLVNGAESEPGRAFANFLPNLWRHLRIFTVWRPNWPDPAQAVVLNAVLILAALLLAGSLFSFGRRESDQRGRWIQGGWPILWLALPWLLGNLLLASNGAVFKEDRYFLFLAPFLLWMMAAGAVEIARRWPAVGWTSAGLLALALAAALPALWSPAMYREEWRAAATHVADYQDHSPGLSSAVVAHVDYTHRPLDWYMQPRYAFDDLPVYGLFGGVLTPDQIDSVIAPPLSGIETSLGAATVWLAQSHLEGVDDDRLVEAWLAQHYPAIAEHYPAGVKLTGYAIRTHFDTLPELASNAAYPDAELVPGLRLRACEITTPVVSAKDSRLHPSGGWVHVRMWWQADAPQFQDLRPTVHLHRDTDRAEWGEAIAQPNSILDRYPFPTLPPGTILRDEADFRIFPKTPPGTYPVLIMLDNQTANCGTVQVR